MEAVAYPIAETFHSIQGEGMYTGVPMHFVRLAGCNVGKAQPEGSPGLTVFPAHTICTNAFGQSFLCDTDYRKVESQTVEQIIAATFEDRICCTGGEPLLHDLEPLLTAADASCITVHIETSGTKPIPAAWRDRENIWISCAPKLGVLDENIEADVIDELKFPIGVGATIEEIIADVDAFMSKFKRRRQPTVWLQPINGVNELYASNAQLALDVLRVRPTWRMCIQVHKAVGLR